jgi:inosine-uridine nucleoside N-ribohydrolase
MRSMVIRFKKCFIAEPRWRHCSLASSSPLSRRGLVSFALLLVLITAGCVAGEPVRMIFDTDMGNDIDDALALAEIHAFESRGEATLLAITISKDNRWAPVFVDLLDTFYGRQDVPIGMVKDGKTPDDGHYMRAIAELRQPNGSPLYPRHLTEASKLPEAVTLLRKTLSAQPDASVVIVQVGFSTNLARLLDSAPDALSPLRGRELVGRKVRLLSMMAGEFRQNHGAEYNITNDIPAAQKLFREWPSQIVTSGFDIGDSIKYPARRVDSDFAFTKHHPLADAYRAYRPMPYDEPLWDPTAVLYAVRPKDGYFDTSQAGIISVDERGRTDFSPSPEGKHRYLSVDDTQRERVREAISLLISAPPSRLCGPAASDH